MERSETKTVSLEFTGQKIETIEETQSAIRAELCEAHGLDPEQIAFAEGEIKPIFDYEAISLLSLKLTDIVTMDVWTTAINSTNGWVTAKCQVVLPDGRSRSTEASASIDETLGSGEKCSTYFRAEAVAHARAARRGIRSVGINLMRAHKRFMETDEVAAGHTRHSPLLLQLQEIHVLAAKIGLIRGRDRSAYEELLASIFEGRTSANDLSGEEREKWIAHLRILESVRG